VNDAATDSFSSSSEP